MQKQDKLIFILLLVLLSIEIPADVFSFFNILDLPFNFYTITSVMHFISLLVMITYSSILRTIYMKIIYFFIGLLFIGSAFKVVHWPFAGIILTCALTGIVLTYTIYFFPKKQKDIMDVLKLLFVILYFTQALFAIFHLPGRAITAIATVFIFYAMFIAFIIQFYKRLIPQE